MFERFYLLRTMTAADGGVAASGQEGSTILQASARPMTYLPRRKTFPSSPWMPHARRKHHTWNGHAHCAWFARLHAPMPPSQQV